jgi:hypothetical protein
LRKALTGCHDPNGELIAAGRFAVTALKRDWLTRFLVHIWLGADASNFCSSKFSNALSNADFGKDKNFEVSGIYMPPSVAIFIASSLNSLVYRLLGILSIFTLPS